jgi:hypothetical protein
MEQSRQSFRPLRSAVAGLLLAGFALSISATTAAAQGNRAQAEQLCTPDVMRLCNEYIPDPNRIVACLKAKRRQLSPGCHAVLAGGGGSKATTRAKARGKGKRKVRRAARR